ncbi:voltage-gated monoatomic cation channel TMEM109 [Synchiropus picturatus]
MFCLLSVRCATCVLAALLVSVSGEKVTETRPKMMEDLSSVFTQLAGEGRALLGRLAGEQTVVSVQKAFSQVIGVVAGSLAAGLNVLIQYVAQFLRAAGFPADLPVSRVTPEGLVFVAQWVILAVIAYWLFSLTIRLIMSTLRRTLWLLKLVLALACFAFILSDHSVGSETIALRLAGLVLVCVLLGVGSAGSTSATRKAAHLENQVKTLEKRVREMEKSLKKRKEQ